MAKAYKVTTVTVDLHLTETEAHYLLELLQGPVPVEEPEVRVDIFKALHQLTSGKGEFK